MQLNSKTLRLARLSSADIWLAIESAATLLWYQARLFAPFARWRIGQFSKPRRAPSGVIKPASSIVTIARIFGSSVQRLPLHGTCLSRSIALRQVLARRGMNAEVCIGLKRGAAGIEGHAWVECDGQILNDSPENVISYTRLTP